MMMDCPRCGFTQPKDKYCASCGLDVDQFLAKPKPWWIRLGQNPNLHLTLLGLLVAVVVAYIFYAQSDRLGREVRKLLKGTPLASRDAGDPSQRGARPRETNVPPADKAMSAELVTSKAPADGTETSTTSDAAKPIEAIAQHVEVSHWEIQRELLDTVVRDGEKIAESSEGVAYFWPQGAKVIDQVQNSQYSRHLPKAASGSLNEETATTSSEAFQFALDIQPGKNDGKEFSVSWSSTMVVPQPDGTSESSSAAATQVPVVKALTETNMKGSANLTAQAVLLIVFEPPNRQLHKDYVNKAGEGPWSVFSSNEFRAGANEWVALVQLKANRPAGRETQSLPASENP
jgi:hypothetical protein